MTSLPLSLRSRTTRTLLVGFLATLAILALVCTYGFLRVHKMNEDLRDAAQGRAHKIALIEGMQSLTRDAVSALYLSQMQPGAADAASRKTI
ncbi:MAG TPA: hypothetical protein VM406_03495, partial [Noviherbaspirillum sp.]|nr:hypothetical protein [Noviherbaspirillum sp.]